MPTLATLHLCDLNACDCASVCIYAVLLLGIDPISHVFGAGLLQAHSFLLLTKTINAVSGHLWFETFLKLSVFDVIILKRIDF